MISVCPGWPTTKEPNPHPTLVLHPENGQAPVGQVSHGMCEACAAAVEADDEEQFLKESQQ